MSTFNSATYRDSAHRRLKAAYDLIRSEHYVEGIYLAGVSVECMLLSFIRTMKDHFDSRHDLTGLLAESGLAPQVRGGACHFHGLVTAVYRRWNNDLRYISSVELKKRYHALGLHKFNSQERIKGDLLEFNAKEIFKSASQIVKEGAIVWETRMTSK